jgi:bifunctional non-homologous end joining protein LigD
MEKITLYCREGGSDKQYTIWIEEDQASTKIERFTVQAQWGRRGGTVQAGTKTPSPVSFRAAEGVMDKVLKEKRAKGYAEGPDAPAFKQVAGAVDSGLRPMLLTDATERGELPYVEDPAWGAQEKMNGKRIMIDVFPDGRVVGVNRRGLECPIPQEVVDAFKAVKGGRGGSARPTPRLTLDGELIGDVYHAFDLLLEADDIGKEIDLRARTTSNRHYRLKTRVSAFLSDNIRIVELLAPEDGKRALVRLLQLNNREGVVFKKLDAPYVPGRVENLGKAEAVKVKFYSEGLFRVAKWNEKSSVAIEAWSLASWDPAATIWTSVGNVTVQAKYVAQISPGKMIRIRYLYATEARILYQPNLDPTDDGIVVGEDADSVNATRLEDLKLEGKEEA